MAAAYRSQLPLRFQRKLATDLATGCWIWTGAKVHHGYGRVRVDGRTLSAHRVVYELLIGPIPEDLVIDHLCRRPACCNPSHMEPVTQAENVRRGKSLITHCPKDHPYDEPNTLIVTTPTGTRRVCRTCNRERARAA